MDVFIIAGVLGLLFISGGVLLRTRKLQDECYVIGGIFLLLYSVHLQAWVFIVLQTIFIAVSVYDLVTKRHK